MREATKFGLITRALRGMPLASGHLRSSIFYPRFSPHARVVKWQTRTFEGRMPQGMGVQVPPRALSPPPPDRDLAPDLPDGRPSQKRIMSTIRNYFRIRLLISVPALCVALRVACY